MDGGARLPHDPGRHWNPRWFVSIGEIRTTKCAEPFFPGVRSTYSDDTTGTPARQASGPSKAIDKSARKLPPVTLPGHSGASPHYSRPRKTYSPRA